jgi:hypothetical protein
VCAAYAFRLDRERLAPLLTLPLQQLLYRQLMYVVLMQSWITALTGGRLRWQKLRRTGLLGAAPGVDGASAATAATAGTAASGPGDGRRSRQKSAVG